MHLLTELVILEEVKIRIATGLDLKKKEKKTCKKNRVTTICPPGTATNQLSHEESFSRLYSQNERKKT